VLRIGANSKHSPQEVIERAKKFFGEGYGLKLSESSEVGASFEGGGGGVIVSAIPEGTGSSVDLESHEWDYQVKEFLGQIK
jgi:hypothetical protein